MRVIQRNCVMCGQPFWWLVKNGVKDASRGKYCSRQCFYETKRRDTPVQNMLTEKLHEVRQYAKKYTLSASAAFLGVDTKTLKKVAEKNNIIFTGKPTYKGWGRW